MSKPKRKSSLLSIIMIIAMTFMLAACGGKTGGADGTGEPPEGEPTVTDTVKVVEMIDEVDTDDMMDLPLQIESITLFDDGSLRVVPKDDLLKNAETNDEVVDGAVYPFADSGKVKEVYLVRFGNGGYRTVICLMEDGTLSALSANELIQDHIFIVMDNLTGRDNYVNVKQVEDADAFGVTGITEDGEEVELDFSLNF